MKTNDSEHFGLGTIGMTKGSLVEYAKLGAGAAAGITVTDLVLSRVLVINGVPIVPVTWGPAAIAVLSVLTGTIVKKRVDADVGLGMIAGGVGLAISEMVKRFTAPAATATNAAAASAEVSGYGAQTLAGFGAGRAFAGGLGGFAGLGQMAGAGGQHLFGVGTPDMSANRMFNGATVAIEDSSAMHGAAVQYEDASVNGFAGSLNN